MKKSAPHLMIALRGDQWISIRSVPSGLACNCFCPACNAALIAKKGRKQQHHFAHAHGMECTASLESTLHRFAKAAIVKAKSVYLPIVKIFRGPVVRPARWVKASTVRTEVVQDKLRLDVLMTSSAFRLAIEIKVTHAVDAYKKQRLIKLGIPAIEIDVQRIYQELQATQQADDLKALRQAILQHPNYRQWLFSPLQHRWEYRMAKEAIQRKVHHSKQGQYHHYHVYRCPLKFRFVRGGFRDGQSYARVFQDCLNCTYCREIVYHKKWVGFREIPLFPQAVLCKG